MQSFFLLRPRIRAALGALALTVVLTAGGPSTAAFAAAPPDFMTVLTATSWDATPGQSFKFGAVYKRKTADNGPVKATIYLQKGFGTPTSTNNGGFSCTKTYHAAGWFPGWHINCSKQSITPGGAWFEAIEIKTTAPTAAGDYLVISRIDPASGDDLFPDDNHDTKKLHVN